MTQYDRAAYEADGAIYSSNGSRLINRRRLMQMGLSVTGGAVLASLASPSEAAVGGKLRVMAWEGFDLQKEMSSWRKAHGVVQTTSVISVQEDVQAKFIGGDPVPLDVAEYGQGYARLYGDELKIIHPIDISRIPNYNPSLIFQKFYKTPTWFWKNTQFGIPWNWGLNALVYNPQVRPTIDTYEDLLRPEFKGKLTIIDDGTATWPIAARLVGHGDKYPNLTKAEMKESFDNLRRYGEQCRVFANSIGDVTSMLVSGDLAACFCIWNGIIQETAKQGVTTNYALPKEGAVMWCDAWFIPTSVRNLDTAYAFINESISAEIQAAFIPTVSGGTVNRDAVPKLDPTARALFDYNNLDAVFEKSPLQGIPPSQSETFATYSDWTQAWTDFKSSF